MAFSARLTDTGLGTRAELDDHDAQLAEQASYDMTPVATYTHSGNRSLAVSVIDVATDTFTAVGHGFNNGDRISVCVNTSNSAIDYINKYLPTGLFYLQYYIVNKTDDTFQLSTTAGGAAIDLTTKATMDLTKWHVELPSVVHLSIINLPASKRYKIRLTGTTIRSFYIQPNTVNIVNVYTETGNTAINRYPDFGLTGNIKIYAEFLIDFTDFLAIFGRVHTIKPATDSTNTVALTDKCFTSTVEANTDITGITLNSIYPNNGFKFEVFKA